jgi:pilus assembly protein CpaE
MADNKIRVLIVDDLPETRENVRKLLQFESDLEVIGHAGTGEDAIRLAEENRPDIVLMDINMPDGDGITASQTITNSMTGAQVIIMSVQSEADYLRRAMLAGARDFLMKPFSGDELVEAVRRVYDTRPVTRAPVVVQPGSFVNAQGHVKPALKEGKVVAVFSPKGGSGCTTVAVNLAVGIAQKGNETLLVDGSLQFGDVGVMLNIKSLASIIDIVEQVPEMDLDLIGSALTPHESGLKVLLSPPRPEMAELVKSEDMKMFIELSRQIFDYIIIDTSSGLNDVNLAMLDTADRIVLVTRQDLPSLKNVSRFFDLSEDLEYEQSKVIMIVNHGSNKRSISVKDIEDTLKWPASAVIPEEPMAYTAADQGRPLVSELWVKRPGAKALLRFTDQLIEELDRIEVDDQSTDEKESAGLRRLFGR